MSIKFAGMQPLTLLDYPNEIASIIFVNGCNLKCRFCQNYEIVEGMTGSGITEEEILQHLLKNKKNINHVVITGGEPSIYEQDMCDFIRMLKSNGFHIKLDTNGTNTNFVTTIIDERLADYIAMDIKTILSPNEYSEITGIPFHFEDINQINSSIMKIMNSGIPYEFRTTVEKTHHPNSIMKLIAAMRLPNHYLQQFEMSQYVFDKEIDPYLKTELNDLYLYLKNINPELRLRGI